MFNSQECVWADLSLKMLGVTVKGLRGFKFKASVEKEHLYAAGSMPIGIQHGNDKFEGELKVLKNDYDRMNLAAIAGGYKSLMHIPAHLITLTAVFKEGVGRPLKTHTCLGVGFTEAETGIEQGAKFVEITLPILFLDLITV